MDRGWKNRSVGATLMNADSSRSHSIFTINIEMMGTGDFLTKTSYNSKIVTSFSFIPTFQPLIVSNIFGRVN